MRNEIIAFTLVWAVAMGALSMWWPQVLWGFALWVPWTGVLVYDLVQKRHAILRNFPIVGHGRYFMEDLRPKIYQYFIESDTNGTPISRVFRTVVYARAKRELDTNPFGTQLDVYEEGYEWMNHSIRPVPFEEVDHHPRVRVGGPDCRQPYDASIFNISAMSFGALSKNAVMALNKGAALAGFAHNTGEGGISPYHLSGGGDLIFQFGTGYFGCRTPDGRFSPEEFQKRATLDQVKMIEVKLSQGAKPGHGGILPARKNTPEIAAIRGVEPGTAVLSPPYHTAFSTPVELMEFIARLRELSGGKPVGFKLCIGRCSEFIALCKAMIETGIKPDFITIDGGEGGTGAAPLEFSNSVGMPFREGLAFAYDALVGYGLKNDIKLFTAGKILTGFHIFRAMALGADACYSARGMMLALGCIQALECNRNTCPTGVATQKPELVKGLVVEDKAQRVANFHDETVEAFAELMAAAGLRSPDQINRTHVFRRINVHEIRRYDQIYPYLEEGCLRYRDSVPPHWLFDVEEADATRFPCG